MKGIFKFAAVGAAAAMIFAGAGEAEAQQSRKVWVTIYRVRQIDDLDPSTPGVTKDRADFYVQITIDGKEYTSEKMATDDGKPGWTHEVWTTKSTVDVRVKLLDDDGNLGGKDDYVDIHPKEGKKDLDMKYNLNSRRISGDISGRRGSTLRSRGGGDSDRGEIWFAVKS